MCLVYDKTCTWTAINEQHVSFPEFHLSGGHSNDHIHMYKMNLFTENSNHEMVQI